MITFKRYTVFPGQFLITSVPSLITTVLGSCVSVCLWDKHTGIAGLNHYLLPGSEKDVNGDPNLGYAATRMTIKSILNRNVELHHLEAKIFGGSNSFSKDVDIFKVGKRNIDAAVEVLHEFGIPLIAQDVGGGRGRKIVFNTATGKVRMKLLTQSYIEANETIHKGFGY